MADWDRTGTGKFAHEANVLAADITLQNDLKAAGNSQSATNTAYIKYHRALIVSKKANGVGFACNTQALFELGTGGI